MMTVDATITCDRCEKSTLQVQMVYLGEKSYFTGPVWRVRGVRDSGWKYDSEGRYVYGSRGAVLERHVCPSCQGVKKRKPARKKAKRKPVQKKARPTVLDRLVSDDSV